jgi:hypothetical protein
MQLCGTTHIWVDRRQRANNNGEVDTYNRQNTTVVKDVVYLFTDLLHVSAHVRPSSGALDQCFPTAGPWHQLYRAARGKYFIVEIFCGE